MPTRFAWLFSLLLFFACGFGAKHYRPAGCVPLDKNSWIDEHPLSNMAYWEYLGWEIRAHGRYSADYQRAFPDTSGHGALIRPFFEDTDTVLQHKTYFVPKNRFDEMLCCISWRQLERYNLWRTEMVYWLQLHHRSCEAAGKSGLMAPHAFWDTVGTEGLRRLPPIAVYQLPDSLALHARTKPEGRISAPLRTICRWMSPAAYQKYRVKAVD